MPPRKILQLNRDHLSQAETSRREYEQSLINPDGSQLDDISDVQFVNLTAKHEYKRVLQCLRDSLGMVNNLNKSDLINYSNSYGRYMDLVKECRKRSFTYIVDTPNGPKPNPIIRMMDESRRDMAESSRRLGMTLDGQLKAAKAKADKEEADMEAMFGGI